MLRAGLFFAFCLFPFAFSAAGQPAYVPTNPVTTSAGPAEVIRQVGFDQKIGQALPLDAVFRDETGRRVELREYFGGKPVVLSLVYYDCPMLCTMILNGAVRSFRAMSFTAGAEFNVVTISFDPAETPELAAAKRDLYLKQYARPVAAAGWHFLTGDPEAIGRVTSAAGFRYVYDAETRQFAHASGIVVVTPDGRIARYFYGIEYSARDIRLALVEASAGKIGSAVDKFLLYCYHYDPVSGKYGLAIISTIRLLGTLTVLALAGFVITMFRRERRGATGQPAGAHRT